MFCASYAVGFLPLQRLLLVCMCSQRLAYYISVVIDQSANRHKVIDPNLTLGLLFCYPHTSKKRGGKRS